MLERTHSMESARDTGIIGNGSRMRIDDVIDLDLFVPLMTCLRHVSGPVQDHAR